MPYGITREELAVIRARDKTCVYCGKTFDLKHIKGNRSNWDSIEHLNHRRDWNSVQSYHRENKPVPEIFAICCFGCNASRNDKSLLDWFKSGYCIERNINYHCVAEVVRKYIDAFEIGG